MIITYLNTEFSIFSVVIYLKLNSFTHQFTHRNTTAMRVPFLSIP